MLRLLLFIFLFVNLTANSQSGNRQVFWSLNRSTVTPPPSGGNVPFSFTEIPYSNVDFQNPGRGAEQWHNGSQSINYPTPDALLIPPDLYYRGQWATDLEGATAGSYAWLTNPSNNWFDNIMRNAINNGQQVSFGIMTVFTGNGKVSYDGGQSAYPLYLHNLMQAASDTAEDWLTGDGDWIPNYNSVHYIGRLQALHTALYNHIMTTTYNGVRYQDAIYAVDIRGYGNYGEWHTSDICNWTEFPNGRQPTIPALKAIINTHTVFADWPLVMMVAAYDGGKTQIPIFIPSPELAWYALNISNAWGPSGFRRDQWGALDSYLNNLLVGNDRTYNGSPPFNTVILNKYKTSPITGEAYPDPNTNSGMIQLESQVITYGATSFGNGNWGGFPTLESQNRIRAAWKRSGYRIKITTGEAPTIITRTTPFTIKTNWVNVGICPAYNNWRVVFELQTGGGSVAWTGTSSKVLKLFRPDQGTVETTDILTVPGSVSAGTYKLVIRVEDPTGFRRDMKLAINTQNADGSYTIFNSVTLN